MLNVLAWIGSGLIVGAVARLLVPGRQSIGLLGTIGLGIVGAILGGAVAWGLWGEPGDPFTLAAWPGYVTAILGAAIVLWAGLKMFKHA